MGGPLSRELVSTGRGLRGGALLITGAKVTFRHVCHSPFKVRCEIVLLDISPYALKGSYDVAKNNIILCIWCNAMCLCGLRFKKHIIFYILYIIVAPLCSAFLKRTDFYKAHRSEKRGVLWLASFVIGRIPQACDGNVTPLTVLRCRVPAWWDKNNKTHHKRGICCIQWGHNYWL